MAETPNYNGKVAEIRTVVQSLVVCVQECIQEEEKFTSLNENLNHLTASITDFVELRPGNLSVDMQILFDCTCDQVHKSLCDSKAIAEKDFPKSFAKRVNCCARLLRPVFRIFRGKETLREVESKTKKAAEKFLYLPKSLEILRHVLKLEPRASTPAISDVLKLDFGSKDFDRECTTPESDLKRKLLNSDSGKLIIVAARHESAACDPDGVAGTGKTSALIGLASDRDIRDRYNDGIQYMSLGQEATVETVIQEIARVTRRTRRTEEADIALEIENSDSLPDAVANAFSWFRTRRCLLLIDDMWPTDAFPKGYLAEFRMLLGEDSCSRIVISTCSNEITREAELKVVFEALEPQGDVSENIFMKYANCSMSLRPAIDKTPAVTKILTWCDGLPISLSVAGSAVALLVRKAESLAKACDTYVEDFEKMTAKYGGEAGPHGVRLADFIRLSLEYMDTEFSNRKASREVDTMPKIDDLYASLCVLKNQVWIPFSVLCGMWGLDKKFAFEIVERFCELRLAALSYRKIGGETEEKAGITLHSLHLQFCKQQARLKNNEASLHSALLHEVRPAKLDPCNLTSENIVKFRPRSWWSIHEDGYTYGNLARHLVLSGRCAELAALLLDTRWAFRRSKTGGIFGLKADFAILDKKLETDSGGTGENSDSRSMRRSFQLVLKAMRLSWVRPPSLDRVFQFEVHGHLKSLAKGDAIIDAFINKLDRFIPDSQLPERFSAPGLERAKIWEVPVRDQCECVAFSPCGSYVAAGAARDIVIADAGTGNVLRRLKGHCEPVRCIRFAGESKKIISASEDKTVRVWEWDKPDKPKILKGHNGQVTSVDVSSGGECIASGSWDQTVRLWNGLTGEQIYKFAQGTAVMCVALFSKGKNVAIGLQDGRIRILDCSTGNLLSKKAKVHEFAVTSVSFSPDERLMATCSWDDTIRIWDTEKWTPIGSPATEHTDIVTSVAFSPDGRQLVSGSTDKSVRLWEVASPGSVQESSNCRVLSQVNVFTTGAVCCVTFSCDGNRIASGSEDGIACIWDAEFMLREKTSNIDP